MQRQYQVNYELVRSTKGRLNTQVGNANAGVANAYSEIQSAIDSLDSGTNAALKAAMERNQRKAQAYLEVLGKLLTFIENSAEQIEIYEQRIARQFCWREGNAK